ncbi:hypothetical protein KSP40_PGU016168 [Platanthera guangdongensis]|uniref:Uncharacterized protein n=1 Tax=Platanthera guangdongensis TaxID=2320717 RepID=A0ABR2M7N5_9ASPA
MPLHNGSMVCPVRQVIEVGARSPDLLDKLGSLKHLSPTEPLLFQKLIMGGAICWRRGDQLADVLLWGCGIVVALLPVVQGGAPDLKEEHPEEESEPSPLSIAFHEDEVIRSSWWACESVAIQQPDSEKIDDSLLCHEVLYPFTSIGESSLQPHYPDAVDSNKDQFKRFSNTYDGFPTLDDINSDTQSDFHISRVGVESDECDELSAETKLRDHRMNSLIS